MDYDHWMEQVAAVMVSVIGLGPDDMPDYLWHDAFDEGATPEDAVSGYLEQYED